jgi:hypothetical protein
MFTYYCNRLIVSYLRMGQPDFLELNVPWDALGFGNPLEDDVDTHNNEDSRAQGAHFNVPDFTSLCLSTRVSKMRSITVGSKALILRGTFRQQFTFHSWQAEMDCRAAFERVPTRRHALHRSRY